MSDKQAEDEKETVVQIIFRKKRAEAVDFEVSFAALLATGVFASLPNNIITRIGVISAASILLIVTVIRRMAVVGRFAREEWVVSRTQLVIEFTSVVCVYQIITSILNPILLQIPVIDTNLVNLNLILLGLTVLLIISHQIVFRDYMLFWGAYFYAYAISFQKTSKSDTISIIEKIISLFMVGRLEKLSYMALKDAIPPGDSKEIVELEEFVNRMDEETDEFSGTSNLPLIIFSILGTFTIFFIPLGLLVYVVADALLVLTTIVCVTVTTHLIHFWYLGYGAMLERELRSLKWQVAGKIFYTLIILVLFTNSTPI